MKCKNCEIQLSQSDINSYNFIEENGKIVLLCSKCYNKKLKGDFSLTSCIGLVFGFFSLVLFYFYGDLLFVFSAIFLSFFSMAYQILIKKYYTKMLV